MGHRARNVPTLTVGVPWITDTYGRSATWVYNSFATWLPHVDLDLHKRVALPDLAPLDGEPLPTAAEFRAALQREIAGSDIGSDALVSLTDAASMLGASRQTILRHHGEALRLRRIGAAFVVSRDAIVDLLCAKRVVPSRKAVTA